MTIVREFQLIDFGLYSYEEHIYLIMYQKKERILDPDFKPSDFDELLYKDEKVYRAFLIKFNASEFSELSHQCINNTIYNNDGSLTFSRETITLTQDFLDNAGFLGKMDYQVIRELSDILEKKL